MTPLRGLQFEGFLPHSVEFLICPDARSKPQGLGGSYFQLCRLEFVFHFVVPVCLIFWCFYVLCSIAGGFSLKRLSCVCI